MKNPFTLKGWLVVAGIAILLILVALLGIQSCRLDKLKKEIAVKETTQNINQEQYRIKEVYIPSKLNELTTDQLATLACNLFGEK